MDNHFNQNNNKRASRQMTESPIFFVFLRLSAPELHYDNESHVDYRKQYGNDIVDLADN